MLNVRGCLSCGWLHGDPWPQHRLFKESIHPLKPAGNYPPRPGVPAPPLVLKNFGRAIAPQVDAAPALVAESKQISEGGDPLLSTVNRQVSVKPGLPKSKKTTRPSTSETIQ